MEKLFCLSLIVVVFAVHADTTQIEGSVFLESIVNQTEHAEAYEGSADSSIRQVRVDLVEDLEKHGVRPRSLLSNVVVSICPLTENRIIGKGKSNSDGRFSIVVPDNVDIRSLRAMATVDLQVMGKTVRFSGESNVDWWYAQRGNRVRADLTLRRDYVSLQGRCLKPDGSPVVGINLQIKQFPHSESMEQQRWYARHTQTDGQGYWKVDGLLSPVLEAAVAYVNNTNVVEYGHAYENLPMTIGIAVRDSRSQTEKWIEMPNISANLRAAVEKTLAAYERKNGKPWRRRAPMVDFPVSTNNVIYVPDIILP